MGNSPSISADGATPLHQAAAQGQLEVVKVLIELAGADANVVDTHTGDRPLHLAAAGGHTSICSVLLEHGADVNGANTQDGRSPLHYAAENGHVAVLDVLAAADGLDVNIKARSGFTPLHAAAGYGHAEFAEWLLAHGADVNARTTNDGWTPLHVAINQGASGMIQVVQLLLGASGIDVNAADYIQSRTPLHSATLAACAYAAQKDAEQVRASRQLPGAATAVEAAGQSERDCVEVVQMLLSCNGINLDAETLRKRETAASIAQRHKHREVLNLLQRGGVRDAGGRAWDGMVPGLQVGTLVAVAVVATAVLLAWQRR